MSRDGPGRRWHSFSRASCPAGFLAHLAQLTGTQFSVEKANRWLEATAAGDLVAHDDLEVCRLAVRASLFSSATFFFLSRICSF